MKIINLFILFLFEIINADVTTQYNYPIDIKSKVDIALQKKDNTEIYRYMAIKPRFSENIANNMVNQLIPKAIKTENEKSSIILYNDRGKSIQFFKSTGTYSFVDKESDGDIKTVLSGVNDSVIAIESKLFPIANEIIANIFGKDAEQFKFLNHEYEYIFKGAGSENKFLKSITYRYGKIKDGFPIVGNTNHVRVTLNATTGKLSKLAIKDFELSQQGKVKRKIKNNSLRKYLYKELGKPYFAQKPTGEIIDYAKVEIEDVIESYFAIDCNGQKLLLPHATFLIKSQLKDGKTIESRVIIPLDVEYSTNIDAEDILEIENGMK
jgi:hypothetical protein